MLNCERDGVDSISDRRGIGGRPTPGAKLDCDSGVRVSMEETCLDGAGVVRVDEFAVIVVDVAVVVVPGGVYGGITSLGGSVW